MEERIRIEEIKHIILLSEDHKKDVLSISEKMITIFVDGINNKPTVDALNIGVNAAAVLVASIVNTYTTDYESQTKILASTQQFINTNHKLTKKIKEESCC